MSYGCQSGRTIRECISSQGAHSGKGVQRKKGPSYPSDEKLEDEPGTLLGCIGGEAWFWTWRLSDARNPVWSKSIRKKGVSAAASRGAREGTAREKQIRLRRERKKPYSDAETSNNTFTSENDSTV